MSGFVVNLTDFVPPARYDSQHWTQAQIAYSLDNVQAYTVLSTVTLAPVDADPTEPLTRNFTVVNAPTDTGWLKITWLDGSGGQAVTDAVPYPVPTGHGAASPSLLSARYSVRHRLRDGVPLLDANPVPFNTVRLEDLSDQVPSVATPVQTTFQVRYDDVPTQRYIGANAVPGTLVAYLDGAWTPTHPSQDVDVNGNFVLPVPPHSALLVSYAWQYFSDGEIDQFVDEARQWLREFSSVTQIPDGLVPALVSYASSRALMALARSATLAPVKAGDSDVDWSQVGKGLNKEAMEQVALAQQERKDYYGQGAEALDPLAAAIAAPAIPSYTPLR